MILDPHARLAPAHVADSTAFEVGPDSYTWDDIVLAATLWGEWQRLRERVRASVTAVYSLRGCEAAPSPDEIERATDEFRYARNLITAAETEAWLSRRALEFDDLLEFVERDLANGKGAPPDVTPPGQVPAETEVDAALWGEAVCSGMLSQLAGRLAHRAAIHERLRREGAGPCGAAPGAAARPAAFVHPCRPENENGDGVGFRASPLRRLQWLRHLDDAFQQTCNDLIAPGAVATEIRLHQLDWVRLRVQYALFASDDAAREVLLCMSEDRRTLAQVGDQVGFVVHDQSWLLEQLDEDLRCTFLGTQPGDVLGPLRWGDDYGVFLVLEKHRPSAEDADVLARAHDAVLGRVLEHEVGRWVRWQERL